MADMEKEIDNLDSLKEEIIRAKRLAERTNKEVVISNFFNRLVSCLQVARDGEQRSGFEPCPEWIEQNQDLINEWINSPVFSADQRSQAIELMKPKPPEPTATPQSQTPEGPQTSAQGISNWNAFEQIRNISENLEKSYRKERHKGSLFKRFTKERDSRRSQLTNLDRALQNFTKEPNDTNRAFLQATMLSIKEQIQAEQKGKPYKLGQSGLESLIKKIESSMDDLNKPPTPKAKQTR